MKSAGERIRMLRLSKGLTQQSLANKLGVNSYTTITKWESGDNFPQGKDLIKLSKLFNTSVDDLLGIGNEIKIRIDVSSYKYIPTAISAGIPVEVDSILENDLKEIEIPDNLMGKWAGMKDIYITKVSGDSMNKVIPDGSVIAVKKTNVNCLKDGDIVVFSDQYEYSVKRFYKREDKLIFRPDSTNKEFYDHITDDQNKNLIIYGKVVLYLVELN